MGAASPSELSLECKPHSHSMLLKSFGDHHHHLHNQHQALASTMTQQQPHVDLKQLEEILSRLEEERLKIDAFKRELPLSMQLLTTAVESSRQQLQAFKSSSTTNQGLHLEEFIPLKQSNPEGLEKQANNSDKANWMTSVQLWSQAADHATKPKEQGDINLGFNMTTPKLALDTSNKQRSYKGGAFHPFSKDIRNSGSDALQELALGSPENKPGESMDQDNKLSELLVEHNNTTQEQQKVEGQTSNITTTNANGAQNSSHRKARRCWSPDLHRRFVNALQMLGGSQVATPKQIRELMKVDGLTNDEVKSHLQKYRLHTRRPSPSPSPSPQAAGGQTPQLVVLGGIWVPPEYATGGHNGPTAMYNPASHGPTHGPTHYCATPMPQEFYTTAQQQPAHHHHNMLHHHQLHVYRAGTTSRASRSSPDQSDVRGGNTGDRSESIEDGKSDSGSWKAGIESGEKGVVGGWRSEEREESNGSQITLKF